MCNKNSTTPPPTPTPSATQTKSIMKKKKKPQQQKQQTNKASSSSNFSSSSSSSSSSLKPLKRRNRTKTRKPKFLSLRLQLSQTQNQPKKSTHQQHQQPNNKTQQQQQQQQNQLNLFPLHPETDMPEENNMAFLFSSDGGGTLNGLLEDESTTLTAATSEEGSLSAMTCPALEGLVRKAMRRRRSDDGSEERWVSYSEVVEEKKELMEEVSSATAATTSFGSLSLKLDHEGILNAWSDKGSLYVAGEEAPQTVPDLFNASLLHNHHAFTPNAAWDGCGCDVGNTWKVPENCGANSMTVKEEMGWKLGQREASVLRYKEKRRSRLFAKRIRYEVRKLNAEKRPRMKGRFVKRE